MIGCFNACSWRAVAAGVAIAIAGCGDGRDDGRSGTFSGTLAEMTASAEMTAEQLDGKTVAVLPDGSRVVEPGASLVPVPPPDQDARDGSHDAGDGRIADARAAAGQFSPDEKALDDFLRGPMVRTIFKAMDRPGELVELNDGLKFSVRLLEPDEIRLIGVEQGARTEKVGPDPESVALRCHYAQSFYFRDRRSYDVTKRHNALFGHSFSNQWNNDRRHFLNGPDRHRPIHYLPITETGTRFAYNDRDMIKTVTHTVTVTGRARCPARWEDGGFPGVKDVDADGSFDVAEKMHNTPFWGKVLAVGLVWTTLRMGIPALFAGAFGPEALPVGNVIGSCIASGVSAALMAAWNRLAWYESFLAGVVGCVTSGGGAQWWKPFAEWASPRISSILSGIGTFAQYFVQPMGELMRRAPGVGIGVIRP